eukprot:2925127-Prymnesium_polylepis.1
MHSGFTDASLVVSRAPTHARARCLARRQTVTACKAQLSHHAHTCSTHEHHHPQFHSKHPAARTHIRLPTVSVHSSVVIRGARRGFVGFVVFVVLEPAVNLHEDRWRRA